MSAGFKPLSLLCLSGFFLRYRAARYLSAVMRHRAARNFRTTEA
jgi:hypothetical protein